MQSQDFRSAPAQLLLLQSMCYVYNFRVGRPSQYIDHDCDSTVSKTSQKSSGTFVVQSAVTQSQEYSGVGIQLGVWEMLILLASRTALHTLTYLCNHRTTKLYDAYSDGLQWSSSVTNLWLVFIVY